MYQIVASYPVGRPRATYKNNEDEIYIYSFQTERKHGRWQRANGREKNEAAKGAGSGRQPARQQGGIDSVRVVNAIIHILSDV